MYRWASVVGVPGRGVPVGLGAALVGVGEAEDVTAVTAGVGVGEVGGGVVTASGAVGVAVARVTAGGDSVAPPVGASRRSHPASPVATARATREPR